MTTITRDRYYDDSLNDDASPAEVVHARKAGRAWAQREADALDGREMGEWCAIDLDALPLVSFAPYSEVEDQYEREHELAEIANEAARAAWEALVARAESDDDDDD